MQIKTNFCINQFFPKMIYACSQCKIHICCVYETNVLKINLSFCVKSHLLEGPI